MAVRSLAAGQLLTRFAFAVPKRVGSAVVRNKIRRRLREILRALPLNEGFDLVISVRPPAAQASFQDLQQELTMLLRRARLIDSPA
jgi:ribonuclease P protein component